MTGRSETLKPLVRRGAREFIWLRRLHGRGEGGTWHANLQSPREACRWRVRWAPADLAGMVCCAECDKDSGIVKNDAPRAGALVDHSQRAAGDEAESVLISRLLCALGITI